MYQCSICNNVIIKTEGKVRKQRGKYHCLVCKEQILETLKDLLPNPEEGKTIRSWGGVLSSYGTSEGEYYLDPNEELNFED